LEGSVALVEHTPLPTALQLSQKAKGSFQ